MTRRQSKCVWVGVYWVPFAANVSCLALDLQNVKTWNAISGNSAYWLQSVKGHKSLRRRFSSCQNPNLFILISFNQPRVYGKDDKLSWNSRRTDFSLRVNRCRGLARCMAWNECLANFSERLPFACLILCVNWPDSLSSVFRANSFCAEFGSMVGCLASRTEKLNQ